MLRRLCSVCVLLTIVLSSSLVFAQSLTTTFASDNGFNGNMFDMIAKRDLTITGFDANLAVGQHTVEVYHRNGTYVGNEASAAGWTLVGSVSVTSAAADQATTIPLNINVPMTTNQRVGWYITTQGTSMRYSGGTNAGDVYVQDSNLQILEGAGCGSNFSSCFSPRVWNGTVRYNANTQPPVVTDIPNQTTLEDQDKLVTVSISDPDTSTNSLVVTATSSNQLLVPNNNISITGRGNSRSLRLIPAANQVGSTIITVTVSDGNATDQDTFSLSVTPVNDPPSFNKGMNITVAEDSGPASFNNWATSIVPGPFDENAQVVLFQVTNNNTALFTAQPSLSANGRLQFTPAPNASGVATLTIQLSDTGGTANGGSNTSAPVTAQITITPVNDPPTAQADQLTTAEDTPLSITLQGQDIDGDALTYVIDTPPANGMLSGQGATRTYVPNTNFNGQDTFRFHVEDGQASSAVVTVTITVTPTNDAPVFVMPTPMDNTTLMGRESQALTFKVVANDPDGDATTLSALNLPNGATFNAQTGDFSWTPAYTDAGMYSMQVVVSDGQLSSMRTINLTITFIDADMDTLPDTWEAQNGLRTDSADSDNDTISDADEVGSISNPRDSDGDQTIDALDDDSDNDSLLDIDEAGDAELATAPVDTDMDGRPNYRDDDSDNDTVVDGSDNCPLVDNLNQANLDSDAFGDVCDDDIDGDGLANNLEGPLQLDPRNPDTDNDTILDGEEVGDPTMPSDSDNNQAIDALQSDSDNDTISDKEEAGDADLQTPAVDSDKDGIPDFQDTDSDNDNIDDNVDNCRIVANPDQMDANQNGIGDACDDDLDGDTIANMIDNCPRIKNTDQADLDQDGQGDVCDDDRDGDNRANDQDNCPDKPNPDQADLDQDLKGDVCDGDIDGDQIADGDDNCVEVVNPGQENMDGDEFGDVCDDDRDGDTVPNDNDACPDTSGTLRDGCPVESMEDMGQVDMSGDMTEDMSQTPDMSSRPSTDGIDSGVSGCGCSSTQTPPFGIWTVLLLGWFGIVIRRRRR